MEPLYFRVRRAFVVGLVPLFAMLVADCDKSVQVGDLKDSGPDAGDPTLLDASSGGDGKPTEPTLEETWRLQSPMIPCAIHALAGIREDDMFIGCSGGRIYRFDGVSANVSYEGNENETIALAWASPDGQVWAVAQSSADPNLAGELLRFDKTSWTKQPAIGQGRITALTGIAANDVWAATAREIFHFDGAVWKLAYRADAGDFRACTFVSANEGYCAGTNGLAVQWDGATATWKTIPNAPWSPEAEIMGVISYPWSDNPGLYFLSCEPWNERGGDHICQAAKWRSGSWQTYQSKQLVFSDNATARVRSALVTLAGPYFILAPSSSSRSAFIFDPAADAWRTFCGAPLTFWETGGKTYVAGHDGLFGTIVSSGSGSANVKLATGSAMVFTALSVAEDGAAWARTEDATVCETNTRHIFRFDRDAPNFWKLASAPGPVHEGDGLSAFSRDHLFTVVLSADALAEYVDGAWRQAASVTGPASIGGSGPSDIWIGGFRDDFGRFNGTEWIWLQQRERYRTVERIAVSASGDAWMIVRGHEMSDTNMHLYHHDGGKLTDLDLGIDRADWPLEVSAVDRSHAWMSGAPAKEWDGTNWKSLSFNAAHVWARSADEVWFTRGGGIYRYRPSLSEKGAERVYQGAMAISHISGSGEHGLAVGAGGLTIEFGRWPKAPH